MSETQNFPMLAKTFEGLEDILSEELVELGAVNVVPQKRAVSFEGDNKILYKANYACRFALRILKPIYSFKAATEDLLYKGAGEIEWWKQFNIHQTFSIDAVVNNAPNFKNSMYASVRVKDAIADQFREKYGERPSVSKENPDFRISVHISGHDVTVSLDSSGESLHRRGYRAMDHIAPINEVLAAALVKLSGWDQKSNLVDPMCGSGTILIEAGLQLQNIPTGYWRKHYAFQNWKDFDNALWGDVRESFRTSIKRPTIKLRGCDIKPRSIEQARENIRAAGLQRIITVEQSDFRDFMPPDGGGFLITNPPYGERISVEDIDTLYKEFGDKLKRDFNGYTAWVISSGVDALKAIELHSSKKLTLFNGALQCKFQKYDIYEGSMKST
jgi:putative N6-adenine-specific DNA methylase